MAIKKQNHLSTQNGSVLVMVIIFTLIFTILAMLAMRIAVLQNADKMREYQMARAFYAADGTVEQAAWLMWLLMRGTLKTDGTFDISTVVFPQAGETPANNNIPGLQPGDSQTQIIGQQQFFGTLSASAAKRHIFYQRVAPFDNPALPAVDAWFPMITTGAYRYDMQDTQQPPVWVSCRVEIESAPATSDGYIYPVSGGSSGNPVTPAGDTPLDPNRNSDHYHPNAPGVDTVLLQGNGPEYNQYAVYMGTDGKLYIITQSSLQINNNSQLITAINFLKRILSVVSAPSGEARYYDIIAKAQVDDITAPNHPFTSVARFHIIMIKSYSSSDWYVSNLWTDPAHFYDYFEILTPSASIPGSTGIFGNNGNVVLRFKTDPSTLLPYSLFNTTISSYKAIVRSRR